MESNFTTTRRKFLLGSSALSLVASLPKPLYGETLAQQKVEGENPVFAPTPKDASLKFNLDGSPRPFAGNTIICHLPQQCRFRDETAALGEAFRASSFAHKCGILPSNSYHMSVFTGANDQDRAVYGWPADVPIDATMAECNRIIGERIDSFTMREGLPIRVRVDGEKTLGPQRVSSLRMIPADVVEREKIRKLRSRLAAEVFRLNIVDHDAYVFHISLAYQLRPLTQEEAKENQTILEHHVPLITAAAPVIELGDPEFCTFDDMFRFEIQKLLRS